MRPLLVLGLMSGTSADGVDAALVEVAPGDEAPRLRLIGFGTFPYPPGLRERILQVATPGQGRTEEICHLNALLGELFADAALRLLAEGGVAREAVDLLGSHGQTIHHRPDPTVEGDREIRSTLQIGEPSVIAERTGITTIADFRPRDMAAGGLGAPLSPLLHWAIFRHPDRGRVVLNIGGISNVTAIPAGASPGDVVAFDCGPGNVLMDAAALKLLGQDCDREGNLAARGRVLDHVLVWLLGHPFLRQAPPKATGRETFGPALLEAARARAPGMGPADLLATLATFTAEAIAGALRDFVFPKMEARELISCGGGSRNPHLMNLLRDRLPGIAWVSPEGLGFPEPALEAMAFALLAAWTWWGRAGNLPPVTGASRPVVLGKITPGDNYERLLRERSAGGGR